MQVTDYRYTKDIEIQKGNIPNIKRITFVLQEWYKSENNSAISLFLNNLIL